MGNSNVISDIFHKYKYYGIAAILTIIMGLIYKNYSPLKDNNYVNITDISPSSVIEKNHIYEPIDSDIIQFHKLFKTLTNDLKDIKELKKDDTSNHLNKLFTKDIVTKKILVDSHSIDKSQDYNTSSYKVSFGSSDNPNSYKNVIGFRLLKSSISIPPFHVIDGFNTFKIGEVIITITSALYTGATLAETIQTAINGVTVLQNYTFVFAPSTLKYTISSGGGGAIFDFDLSGSRHLAKVLGFNAALYSGVITYTSSFAGNFTQTYVDLVIPEIPLIVCKDNSKGLAVIDRIPLIHSEDKTLSFYQTNSSEYQSQNYFFPQKLNTLTIMLYQDSDQNILYDSQNGDNTFEFEVTILKNTAFMNT